MSTKRDSSIPSPLEIRYAVRQAALLLPEEQRKTLQKLLRSKRAPLDKMLALFRETPQARAWLERALYHAETVSTRGYESLAGEPGPIPARSLWKCPKCDFAWRVLRKGRPVPPCPHDGSKLEPVAQKEQNDAG